MNMINGYKQLTVGAAVFACMAALSGCNGGSGGANTGQVSFSATDAPVDGVDQVSISFDKIELKPAQGPKFEIELDALGEIENLLLLTEGQSQLVLDQETVPAGRYNYVRLFVESGFVLDATGQHELLLPGQQENAANRFLHLHTGFVVPVGGSSDFTIDFDLRKALTKPAGADYYLLRPALRLVDNLVAGSIYGTVSDLGGKCPDFDQPGEVVAVYIYADDGEPLGDVHVDENGYDIANGESRPLATANVTQNESGGYEYTFGFVAEGFYRLGLTCGAAGDMPETDDATTFPWQINNVEVVAGEESMANF